MVTKANPGARHVFYAEANGQRWKAVMRFYKNHATLRILEGKGEEIPFTDQIIGITPSTMAYKIRIVWPDGTKE